MQNQPPMTPPIDSKDYVIKILSERCQLFEKNIRTLATEIARLNQLKNGELSADKAEQAKTDEKKKPSVVVDINKNKDKKKAASNDAKAQKLLMKPKKDKKPDFKEPEKVKLPTKPEADGNVKDPDTTTEPDTPADHE
jgi:hypothetical protein